MSTTQNPSYTTVPTATRADDMRNRPSNPCLEVCCERVMNTEGCLAISLVVMFGVCLFYPVVAVINYANPECCHANCGCCLDLYGIKHGQEPAQPEPLANETELSPEAVHVIVTQEPLEHTDNTDTVKEI